SSRSHLRPCHAPGLAAYHLQRPSCATAASDAERRADEPARPLSAHAAPDHRPAHTHESHRSYNLEYRSSIHPFISPPMTHTQPDNEGSATPDTSNATFHGNSGDFAAQHSARRRRGRISQRSGTAPAPIT